MRNVTLKLFTLLTLFALAVSCMPEQSETSSSTNNNDSGSSFDFGNGSDPGAGSGSNNNNNSLCVVGTGIGFPPHQFDMIAAGHTSWVPGNYTSGIAGHSMPTLIEASLLFKSDNDFKFIFKIKSQPTAPRGEEFCAGRATGQAGDAHNYTKLKFTMYLRDILCASPDPVDTSKCLVDFTLGSRYGMKTVGPINVNGCSPIIDMGSKRNTTQFGTTVEITNVRSDSTCQYNGQKCPSDEIVRAASCWEMSMQFENDYTQDL